MLRLSRGRRECSSVSSARCEHCCVTEHHAARQGQRERRSSRNARQSLVIHTHFLRVRVASCGHQAYRATLAHFVRASDAHVPRYDLRRWRNPSASRQRVPPICTNQIANLRPAAAAGPHRRYSSVSYCSCWAPPKILSSIIPPPHSRGAPVPLPHLLLTRTRLPLPSHSRSVARCRTVCAPSPSQLPEQRTTHFVFALQYRPPTRRPLSTLRHVLTHLPRWPPPSVSPLRRRRRRRPPARWASVCVVRARCLSASSRTSFCCASSDSSVSLRRVVVVCRASRRPSALRTPSTWPYVRVASSVSSARAASPRSTPSRTATSSTLFLAPTPASTRATRPTCARSPSSQASAWSSSISRSMTAPWRMLSGPFSQLSHVTATTCTRSPLLTRFITHAPPRSTRNALFSQSCWLLLGILACMSCARRVS